MEWRDVRDEFTRTFRASGWTQKAFAKHVGISGQSQLSKLLKSSDTWEGPAVMMLLKAIEALDGSVSGFFARVERNTLPLEEADRRLGAAIRELMLPRPPSPPVKPPG